MGTWNNDDGLYIKFGTTEGEVANGGSYRVDGAYSVSTLTITGTDLATGAAIMNDVVWIPDNARIDKVEIVPTTAMDSSGDAATLNVGLIQKDRSTEIDYNGLVAALPEASMDPAGDWQTIDVNHTYKGALIGTTITEVGYVTADWDTEAFTAGEIEVHIYWRQIS